jgi:hypothetical protein
MTYRDLDVESVYFNCKTGQYSNNHQLFGNVFSVFADTFAKSQLHLMALGLKRRSAIMASCFIQKRGM